MAPFPYFPSIYCANTRCFFFIWSRTNAKHTLTTKSFLVSRWILIFISRTRTGAHWQTLRPAVSFFGIYCFICDSGSWRETGKVCERGGGGWQTRASGWIRTCLAAVRVQTWYMVHRWWAPGHPKLYEDLKVIFSRQGSTIVRSWIYLII